MCVSDKLGESVRGWEEEEGGREGGKRKQGGSGVSGGIRDFPQLPGRGSRLPAASRVRLGTSGSRLPAAFRARQETSRSFPGAAGCFPQLPG